jgi:trehalose 6-phosphate phosphatase
VESLDDLATRVARVLANRPAGLTSDFDGTLARIVASPADATIEPAIRETLSRIARSLDLVAIVTGRSVDDVRSRVGLDGVTYIGNHGLERWERGTYHADPDALAYVPRLGQLARVLAEELQMPGVEIEPKKFSIAVHYRRAVDPDAAVSAIGAVLAVVAQHDGLRVAGGKSVFELRLPLDRDKGTALTELVMRRGLRGVVFLGDDRTDLDAMRALAELRERKGVEALSIGVLSEEAAPELSELADAVVEGVDGVAMLLERVVRLLGG